MCLFIETFNDHWTILKRGFELCKLWVNVETFSAQKLITEQSAKIAYLFGEQPADVSEEHASSRVMRIRVGLGELVMQLQDDKSDCLKISFQL